VLAQQIMECFIGEFLKVLHAVPRQHSERKTMMRLWAKREEQIRGVVESTAGLDGDLQGIAGRSLAEIDGLELPLLDGPASDAAE
jgi:hypothetical protein